VRLFAFFYLQQRQGHELINTENVLIGERAARMVESRVHKVLDRYGNNRNVVEATLKQGANRILIWYWYDLDGVSTISPLRAKSVQIKNGLRGQETPAALVTLAARANLDRATARTQLGDFLRAAEPTISLCLWQTETSERMCTTDDPGLSNL